MLSLARALAGQSAEDGILTVSEAVEAVAGGNVHIYLLDLSVGEFVRVGRQSDDDIVSFAPREIQVAVDLLQRTHRELFHHTVPRGSDTVAHVFFSVGNPSADLIISLCSFLPFLFNRRAHERFSSGLHRQISAKLSLDDFFSELAELAKNSSGVQYGAYRQLNGSVLTCYFNWGFSRPFVSPDEMTIRRSEIDVIDRAIDGKVPVFCPNLLEKYPDLSGLRPFRQKVVSFLAVPVLVSSKVLGVITFGNGFRYDFTHAERASLLSLANILGVAINNRRLEFEGKTRGAEFERISSAIVGVEVAQSIRHNIYKSSGNIIKSISLAEARVKKSAASNSEREGVVKALELASAAAKNIESEVRQLKDVMTVDRTIKVTDVKSLWGECQQHLGYDLERLEIGVSSIRSHPPVPLLSDLVKHIFHNLMLNSIDALEGIAKHRRQISLRLEKFDLRSKIIQLMYSDTGPGLDSGTLMAHREALSRDAMTGVSAETALGELIFRPRVTTKKDGTGFGLFLCRQMAGYHGGGIEFVSPGDNNGVLFRITLSFDLYLLADRSDSPLLFIDEKRGTREVLDIERFLHDQRRRS